MIYGFVAFLALMLIALISFVVICVGMQEANDPSEARPEDLTEFEKRYVHRKDIVPRL